DFDMKVFIPTLRKVVNEFGIQYDKQNPVPADEKATEDLFEAAVEFLSRVGIYCQDTNRVIQFSRKEIIDAIQEALGECFVGEGKEAGRLRQLTAELDLGDSVIFTGFREDIPRLLSLFDVFVISSYLEGLCTSILDAMAAGVPVVATETGGIPEVVKDEENGILVPPRDPKRLAEGVLRVLNDSNLAQGMVKAGHSTVRRFSAEQMAKKTEEIYRSVLREKRGGVNYRFFSKI
ncbi:MAG: glycosyltransferase, partial [Candidatus Latescibacteria bacterium]|nr:glycosyltransferase [Candidatus Latescibacterota bacterium]